jgi:hypothetical protein
VLACCEVGACAGGGHTGDRNHGKRKAARKHTDFSPNPRRHRKGRAGRIARRRPDSPEKQRVTDQLA